MTATRNLAVLAVLAALLAPAARAADDAAHAAELYQLCAQCHGDAGQGNQAALAPAIAGLPEWYVAATLQKFRGGIRGLHHEDTGGLRMYPMSLTLRSDADLTAVARHVASLPPANPAPVLHGGDPARGAQVYNTVCFTCHGADGGGNQQMNGPPLRHASDWYLLSSLQKFQTGVRGADPRDSNAALMRGFSQTLVDDQAKKDVIAHILSLGNRTAAGGAPAPAGH